MIESPECICRSPVLIDPLAQAVALLQPTALYSKIASGSGRWSVHRRDEGRPFYAAVVEGSCRIAIIGQEPRILETGHFVLVPASSECVMSSLLPAGPEHEVFTPVLLPNGEFRVGKTTGPHDVKLLMGYCVFGSPDASLLVSLLPQLVHIRGESRLGTLVKLVVDESRAQRPARDIVLSHLLEVLFIEAFRSADEASLTPGLMRGLADERVAAALRKIHEDPARAWTVAGLAGEAALSRSAFFERFQRAVGVAPMEYLLTWRMALAKSMLSKNERNVAEVAEQVGYGSASTFSVAFRRHVGVPPATYARKHVIEQEDPVQSPV